MQWIVVGSDDMYIRVYNYNTLEKVTSIEAHGDYIRHLVVHPQLPYLLTSSDDCTVKAWDWEKNWETFRTYEGHGHYVMQVSLNPKDLNAFATASLDSTIKVWGITGTTAAHFTLSGHTQGINCVEYVPEGDKPYLISGADDMTVRIWDYQTKQCVHVLEGHSNNIAAVSFHPDLPLIVSSCEDCTVKLWHATTYRLEQTLNYGLDRTWCHSTQPGTKLLAIGYDEGTVVIKLGSEEPVASMTSTGLVIWAKNNEIHQANLKIGEFKDGEIVPLVSREMETCEIFPQTVKHSPNGRFFVVCGDGEYVIKSARAFRNQGYGTANEFAWSTSYVGDFAVREQYKIKVMRGSDEHYNFRAGFTVECIFGGYLLGVRSDEFICFYDWEKGTLVRRIDACPKQVYWSDSGNSVALVLDDRFYYLRFDRSAIDTTEPDEEEGYEDAFIVEDEIVETVTSAMWLSECFIFTNDTNKLNYYIGGKVLSILNLENKMHILGYVPGQSKLYLIDNQFNIMSHELPLSFVEYQIAVVLEDFDRAESIYPQIPEEYHSRCARFLDGLGYKDEAFAISTDLDHKFELALQLNRLEEAKAIAEIETNDPEAKWKRVGELALLNGQLEIAEACMIRCEDFNGLLLLYSSLSVPSKIEQLAELAAKNKRMNITFLCYFLLNNLDKCLETLIASGRISEAAFFARTYCPSKISSVIEIWRKDLEKVSRVAAQSLSDPTEYPQHFPELSQAIQCEEMLAKYYSDAAPASEYMNRMGLHDYDMLENMKENPDFQISDLLDAVPEGFDDPFAMEDPFASEETEAF